jgi:hypothetical protein
MILEFTSDAPYSKYTLSPHAIGNNKGTILIFDHLAYMCQAFERLLYESWDKDSAQVFWRR